MCKIFPKYFILCALACLIFAGMGIGGTSSKSIVASRLNSSITIDGLLDEQGWRTAVPVSGFTQYDPEEGAAATEATVVRALYDNDALYIGVICYDGASGEIVQQLTRRDRIAQADRFSVTIDSYHDHSTAFLFSGSVSGVKSDGVLSQDGFLYDVQWDAVWDFDAKLIPDGWSAEFRIPFSAIRFSAQDSEYVWGINFRRFIARKKETDEWVMVPRREVLPGTVSSVSKMGHVSGITNIHPPLHIELLPYQVSNLNYLTQPDPFPIRNEFKATGGLDMKYGLTNDLTFDLTVNPDFGQVEVDQAVLNLTVFETFYPEKRPFFLEGSQIFTFGNSFDNSPMRLFYSRRIGRKPSAPTPADSGYEFVETPQTTRILGAGKLTGQTRDGLTLGLISAVTDREYGYQEKTDMTGDRKSMEFEPRASYNVLRLKKDVFENSSVGLMAASIFNNQHPPVANGGFDWNLKLFDGEYALDGYLVGSRAFTPHFDATGAASLDEITGGAGKLGFGKLSGEHWFAFSAYDFSSRNFSINDIGFYSQPREQGGYTQVSYKEDRAAEPVRRYVLTLQSQYRWNWEGASTLKQLELESAWEFRNFWLLTLDYYHDLEAFDDINRGINGLYRRPSGNRLSAKVQTDPRQQAVLTCLAGSNTTQKGSSTWYTALQLALRPNTWMEFTPALTVSRSRNEESWVQSPLSGWPVFTGDGFNLFGDRDVDQYDFSLRGTVTFTRSLSLQFFTQVFLAKGRYENFTKLISPDDLLAFDYPNSLTHENPDFNEKIFNTNLVFRWEYLPGSTFYLVWTQARYGNESVFDKTLSENFSGTFRLPMDNVLLAKISYWWSL